MDDKNSKRIKAMFVGQIIDRIILILVFFLLIGNLVATAYMAKQIKDFTEMIEPAINVISMVDPVELNKTLTTLNSAIDVFKINEALDTISQIDFTGFQEVISGIDVDKLNKTLDKIDDATQFLQRIGDGMNKFLNQFGINVGN
ncbi:MAG: hypothetical protein J5840_01135 [Lachnospiraceae bacterium]|nr:hypothetical protein [Lachnospiraceae bacterium]